MEQERYLIEIENNMLNKINTWILNFLSENKRILIR